MTKNKQEDISIEVVKEKVDLENDNPLSIMNMDISETLESVEDIINVPQKVNSFARMVASGMFTRDDICKALLIDEETYIDLMASDEVIEFIKKFNRSNDNIVNARMNLLSDRAIDVMTQVLNGKIGKTSDRISVAKDILDRTGYKAKEKKEVNVTHSYEMSLFNEMGIDLDNIPDVDFEEV